MLRRCAWRTERGVAILARMKELLHLARLYEPTFQTHQSPDGPEHEVYDAEMVVVCTCASEETAKGLVVLLNRFFDSEANRLLYDNAQHD